MRSIIHFFLFIILLFPAALNAANIKWVNTSGNSAYDTAVANLITSDYYYYNLGNQTQLTKANANAFTGMNNSGLLYSNNNYNKINIAIGGISAYTDGTADYDDNTELFLLTGDKKFMDTKKYFAASVGFPSEKIKTLFNMKNRTYLTFNLAGFSAGYFMAGSRIGFELISPTKGFYAKWYGLTLTTGLVFTYFNDQSPDEIDFANHKTGTNGTQTVIDDSFGDDPDLIYHFKAYCATLPLELTTSARLLIFDFYGGIGADFSAGICTTDFSQKVGIYDNDSLAKVGYLEISDAQSSSMPTVFRPKILAGIGLSLFRVKLEAGTTLYIIPSNTKQDDAEVHFTAGYVY